MAFHPPLIQFLSVGFGGMAIAALLAVGIDRIDTVLSARRKAARQRARSGADFAGRRSAH
ncbi:MAG TPA: hypothetical protein VFE79_06370 [Paraburkholderia sp.]|jgi:hypothetical protein|nr:hypothetical protein [Paraburkholderia sp.]